MKRVYVLYIEDDGEVTSAVFEEEGMAREELEACISNVLRVNDMEEQEEELSELLRAGERARYLELVDKYLRFLDMRIWYDSAPLYEAKK